MRIVADENIPFVADAFSTIGEVTLRQGRAITPEDVRTAEILLVRSVTEVGPALLAGSRIRFVGTATIGVDHLDVQYLASRGITYASAPASNADSVADWFVAALLTAAGKLGLELEGKVLGVIGCGNVGSRVANRGRALGMRVIENDPPLADATGDPRYRPISEVLAADVVTMHTPLIGDGPYRTYHLADHRFLSGMKGQSLLINAGRGACLDGAELRQRLETRRIAGACLDVWENEPSIDRDLLRLVHVATPHIAGYSLDGKVRGTSMLYERTCQWLGVEKSWSPESSVPSTNVPILQIDAKSRTDQDVLTEAVSAVYSIEKDDAALRMSIGITDAQERARLFDLLRKNYPQRRELSLTRIDLKHGSPALQNKLQGIGFQVRS